MNALSRMYAIAAMRLMGAVAMFAVSALFPVISSGAGAQYVYDGAGRLVQVQASDGSSAVYKYDAAGNIVSVKRLLSTSLAVTAFSPATGPIGSSVTVSGSGFSSTSSNNTVQVNGTAATVSNATTTSMTIIIPAGATTGPIQVTNSNGTVSTSNVFTVGASIAPPTISGLSPLVGASGTSITVNGSGFQTPASADKVLLGKLNTTVSSASASSLSVTVPTAAVSGRVRVSTVFGTATSAQTFFVPPSGYAASDVVASGQISNGTSQSANIATAGKVAMYSFEGLPGQRVTLTVSSSSFNSCSSGIVKLFTPEGSLLGSTTLCASAYIDAVTLPTAGSYIVTIIPASTSSGTLSFVVSTIADLVSPIIVDGSSVALTTTAAGQNYQLTFSGTAQQRVALSMSLPVSACYPLTIKNPDNSTYLVNTTTAACSTSYFSDVLTLPQTGTYTIYLNPTGTTTGQTTFTLKSVAADVVGTLSVDGSAVSLTTTTAGQNYQLTFSGTAQQRVALSMSLPVSACYPLTIKNPDNSTYLVNTTTAACSTSYFSDVLTLPQTGTYTIYLNPTGTTTGQTTFTLKSVAADVVGTLVIGGSAVSLTTTTAGQNYQLTFSGTSQQKTTLTMSLPAAACYPLTIKNPDNSTYLVSTSSAACSYSYSSGILTLPQTGTYTIYLNPTGTTIGQTTFTLKAN